MNMKKQLLLLAMILLPLIANAHDIEVKNADDVTIYYKWNADKTELSVTYRGNDPQPYLEYSDNVVIPESVNYEGKDYPVTSIGDWSFCSCPDLTSVTIPNSVTDIDDYAFNCLSKDEVFVHRNSVNILPKCDFLKYFL